MLRFKIQLHPGPAVFHMECLCKRQPQRPQGSVGIAVDHGRIGGVVGSRPQHQLQLIHTELFAKLPGRFQRQGQQFVPLLDEGGDGGAA